MWIIYNTLGVDIHPILHLRIEVDIGEVDSAIAVKKIIEHQKNTNEHVEIVSAGDIGLRFWEEFSLTVDNKHGNYFEFNIATDRFYDIDDTYASKFLKNSREDKPMLAVLKNF